MSLSEPNPLPWHLVDSEQTWNELVVPFIDAAMEMAIRALMFATTDSERAICQGKIIVLKYMKDAPDEEAFIKGRADKLEEERLKGLEVSDGRRGTARRPRR